MVIRHTPRTPSTPRDDIDPDPEQARRTLFPGEGSTLGSPRMVSSRRQRNSNGGSNTSIRYSTIFLAGSAALSAMSLFVTYLTWQTSRMASSPNMLLQAFGTDATISLGTKSSQRKLIQAMQKAPLGSLGPAGTNRTHLHYYDTLFFTAVQFGADAKSIIEVGCASDPFIQYLDWIDQRTCVAPYFVQYGNSSKTNEDLGTKIETVTADFMEYQLPNEKKFDLLLCNQVLEHVPDPASFMQKLIASAKTSIISVPYNWEGCGEICNHKTDFITMSILTEWSAPYVPVYRGIVTEDGDGKFNKRIIFVFETSQGN